MPVWAIQSGTVEADPRNDADAHPALEISLSNVTFSETQAGTVIFTLPGCTCRENKVARAASDSYHKREISWCDMVYRLRCPSPSSLSHSG